MCVAGHPICQQCGRKKTAIPISGSITMILNNPSVNYQLSSISTGSSKYIKHRLLQIRLFVIAVFLVFLTGIALKKCLWRLVVIMLISDALLLEMQCVYIIPLCFILLYSFQLCRPI